MSARIHVVMLVVAIVVWILAVPFGWLASTVFVSHISMAAIVYTAVTAIEAALAKKAVKDLAP